MQDKHDALTRAQEAFNAYVEAYVRPALGISEAEEDQLTLAEQARRISDPDMRRKFVRLAQDLAQANINRYRDLATPLPAPERSPTVSIVLALVAATIGYSAGGTVIALLAAALGFWYGQSTASYWYRTALSNVEKHNAGAGEWKEFVENMERDLEELRAV